MADVQTENGAIMIANELMRQVFIKGLLSKTQLQVVFFIIDESWGWIDRRRSTQQNKVKHKSTRRAVKPKEIADKTELHISDVCKILAALIEARVIRKHWDYYRFNKDYDKWDMTKKAQKKGESPRSTGGKPKNSNTEYGGSDGHMLGEFPSESQVTREKTYQITESNVINLPITAEILGEKPSELGNLPSKNEETREITYQQEAIPGNPLESPLGKLPNATRGIPYDEWGKHLMRWPAILRAARLRESLNITEIELNKVWCLYLDHPDYIMKTRDLRYTPDDLDKIIEYWNCIKFTRTSGKLGDGIFEAEMEYWEKFDVDIVIATLWVHVTNYKNKREDYTRGIMRRNQESRKRGYIPDAIANYEKAVGLSGPIRSIESSKAHAAASSTTKKRITDDDFDELGISAQ